MLGEGVIQSPVRHGSVTPTPGNPRNTTSNSSPRNPRGDEVAETYTPPPRNTQSGQAGTSRHGKQRMIEPYSDEETGAGGDGGDVPMEDNANSIPHRQQYGGVRFIFIPIYSHIHSSLESTRNRGRRSQVVSIISQPHPRIYQRSFGGTAEGKPAERRSKLYC